MEGMPLHDKEVKLVLVTDSVRFEVMQYIPCFCASHGHPETMNDL